MSTIGKIARKTIAVWKRDGIKGIAQKIENVDNQIDIPGFYGFICDNDEIPFSEEDYKKHIQGDKILNWVIPEMGVGSGGHINIFRFILNLQKMGFQNRIYVHRGNNLLTNQKLKDFLKEHYEISDSCGIEIYCDVKDIQYAHATIATSWQTAYFVRKFNNTLEKFYFVQDFEPYFYAKGSEYIFAENTYKFGFKGITAGDWLKEKLHEEYGMVTESFGFSYDHDMYTAHEKRDDKNRIFMYARPVTARRSFELGLLALCELHKRMPDIEVIFAGWDISNYKIPFTHLNAGSVKLSELSDLYAQCDMCLVFSNTNLSLLPLEVMASNSVVVCNDGDHCKWLTNDENSILVAEDPIKIADKLEYYLKNKGELEAFRIKGQQLAHSTSWVKEAEKVRDFILKELKKHEE